MSSENRISLATSVIENKAIGFNSLDVAKCESILQLKEWKLALEMEVVQLNNKLQEVMAEYRENGTPYNEVWYAKTNSYRSLQALLKKQVDFRLKNLKQTTHRENMQLRITWWKKKVEYLAPNLYEDFMEEYKAHFDELQIPK